MKIAFKDEALSELYLTGRTSNKKYKRLPTDIIKRFAKVVNYLYAATRIEDLYLINSLHYEKKQGDLKGISVVWINDQYRLHFTNQSDNDLVSVLLIEISKHYE